MIGFLEELRNVLLHVKTVEIYGDKSERYQQAIKIIHEIEKELQDKKLEILMRMIG